MAWTSHQKLLHLDESQTLPVNRILNKYGYPPLISRKRR
jgi:hypothetical protein